MMKVTEIYRKWYKHELELKSDTGTKYETDDTNMKQIIDYDNQQ